MVTRYTAVFEFPDGTEPPAVGAGSDWLGGKVCAVQFSDALAENEKLQSLLDERPAVNAALQEAYAAWTAKVYRADMTAGDGTKH